MPPDRDEATLRQVGRLFGGGGTTIGLSEGELLERFSHRRDEAAFEALVARHGPMVLGVCRRHLRDPHAVEDAFQATFLVLVRRAGSIRDRDLLGNWLYGVARRVARRASVQGEKTRIAELPSELASSKEVAPSASTEETERAAILDEELARLPEAFRAPIILCALEGLSHEQAAERLRCPVGTVRSRMARGRDRLRNRLTRRGIAPTLGMGTILGGANLSRAAVPPALLDQTIRAALAVAATSRLISVAAVSAGAASLARGVLTTMMLNQLKVVGVALAVAAGVAGSGAVLARQYGGGGQATFGQSPRVTPPGGGTNARKPFAFPPTPEEQLQAIDRQLEQAEKELLEAQALVKARESIWIGLWEQRGRFEGELVPVAGRPGGAPPLTGSDNLEPKPRPPLDPNFAGLGMPPKLAEYKKRFSSLSPGSVLVLPGIATGKIAAFSDETGSWETLPLEPGVTAIGVNSGSVCAPMLKGPKITKIAAFVGRTGHWSPLDLREPVEGEAKPVVGQDFVVYILGRRVYALHADSAKWGVLELEEGAAPTPNFSPSRIHIVHDGKLYVFSARTGTWSGVDEKGNPQPTSTEPKPTVEPVAAGPADETVPAVSDEVLQLVPAGTTEETATVPLPADIGVPVRSPEEPSLVPISPPKEGAAAPRAEDRPGLTRWGRSIIARSSDRRRVSVIGLDDGSRSSYEAPEGTRLGEPVIGPMGFGLTLEGEIREVPYYMADLLSGRGGIPYPVSIKAAPGWHVQPLARPDHGKIVPAVDTFQVLYQGNAEVLAYSLLQDAWAGLNRKSDQWSPAKVQDGQFEILDGSVLSIFIPAKGTWLSVDVDSESK